MAFVLLTGCSSSSNSENLPTRDPAVAATAPTPTTTPAGEVTPLGTPIAGLFAEASTGRLAALDITNPKSSTLLVIDPAKLAGTPGVDAVSLPAPGVAISQGKPGEVLIPAAKRILRVDLATRAVTEVPVAGDARSVQYLDDGRLLVGTADGKVRTLSPQGAVVSTVDGLASADALTYTDDRVTVLDRRQTSVTEIEPGKDGLGLSLRAGDGATTMISDRFGRILVTDTAGGELLVFSAAPLVLRQRFPVNSSPYALAYDQRSDTVWVTCTQSNEVVGFDLSTGIPKEVGRYATVRQPNSVTIEQRTGDMFVGSATGDGLQRIRADDRKRGH
nr:hypothetical protein [Nocardia altamirensis]